VAILAARRPRTCPTSLLTFYIPALFIHVAFSVAPTEPSNTLRYCHGISGAASALSIFAVVSTPLTSSIPLDAPGTAPSNSFRSPEDNSTILQFLTVSWIGSILSLGTSGHLRESHVGQPTLELQCTRVCEKFHGTSGSIFSRLCQSNAVDLAIMSILTVFELACGESKFSSAGKYNSTTLTTYLQSSCSHCSSRKLSD
jgi:hypothetical protein